MAQRGDGYARCFNISSDDGTTTTCICQEGTPTDRLFHDTDCDRTKDAGEEWLDAAASGDSVSVDSVAVTDPDFQDGGDINFTDTSNVVTATINAGAVAAAELAATITWSDGDLVDFSGITVDSATEGMFIPSDATTCGFATGEAQICWEEDNASLWVVGW
jgi:hypothetical protein